MAFKMISRYCIHPFNNYHISIHTTLKLVAKVNNKLFKFKKEKRVNKPIFLQKILLGILFIGFLGSSNAANFTVNQSFDGADATPGDGLCATGGGSCTLRAAVMESNALAGADSITIPAGTYILALGNTGEDAAAEGDLDILDDLTITGADPATTEINGNTFTYRVFSILKRNDNSLPVVDISNLTLKQGLSDNKGALIYNEGELTMNNITLTDASPDIRAMVNVGNININNSRINNNERGIYSANGAVIITNSEFINNVSSVKSGSAFYLASGTATISNTIYSNNTSRIGGAIYNENGLLNLDNCQLLGNFAIYPSYAYRAKGGAVFSSGDIHVSNTTFDGNQAEDEGGALYLEGSASTIVDSDFSNNIASDGGGGIYANLVNDTLIVKRITMIGNEAINSGGGIFVRFTQAADRFRFSESILANNVAGSVGGGIILGTAYKYRDFNSRLRHIEISGNTAQYGGGIYTEINGSTLQNVTITENTATINGGGLYQNANIDKVTNLIHVTIADNIAPSGLVSNIINENGILRLSNTLLSVPAGEINCSGSITTLGYNLSSDASCALGVEGDQINTNSLLGGLADNGGFTWTMALQAGSPAIDAGNTVLCASLNPLDQRYYYRDDAACDIGAYEYNSVRAQSGTLAFTTADFNVNEADGAAIVTFSRTGGSEGIVGISVYDTELGTAGTRSSNYDYDTITSIWLEWADGDSTDKILNIVINDDNVIESNETILLQLGGAAYLYGGASLSTSAATVTIVNDDMPGEAQFSSANYTVPEDGSFINVFVERINGNTAVSVDYETSDGTAIAGTDYAATSGTLNFAIGETSKSFFVNVTDNALNDGNKTINLTLSNPLSGLILGIPATAVLTIVDDEISGGGSGSGIIAFDSVLYTTSENDSTVIYTLVRTGGVAGVVSVDVTIEDGSALFGTDYNASNQSFMATFQDGESSITGTVSIIDDLIVELEEGFIIRLSNPQGGSTLGFIDSTAIVITDNDSNNSGGTGGTSTSSNDGGGGGGTLNPLVLLGLLFVSVIRRCKRL